MYIWYGQCLNMNNGNIMGSIKKYACVLDAGWFTGEEGNTLIEIFYLFSIVTKNK